MDLGRVRHLTLQICMNKTFGSRDNIPYLYLHFDNIYGVFNELRHFSSCFHELTKTEDRAPSSDSTECNQKNQAKEKNNPKSYMSRPTILHIVLRPLKLSLYSSMPAI